MILIWGERICGRVDLVPGKCHVATRFFHLYYVPLIPLSSWVIVNGTETEQGFHGQPIRMSGKSVFFGWLQAALVIYGFINCIWGGIQIAERHRAANNATDGTVKLVIGLLCLGAWVLFNIRPLHASEQRAQQLLETLGVASLSREEDVS